MKYETVIGIEIHCELKTKTKMFSSAPVAFGEVANTCVNEVDLGCLLYTSWKNTKAKGNGKRNNTDD